MAAKSKKKGTLNPELIKAFDYLVETKRVDENEDVVKDTGFLKSQVSSYLSGNVKASKPFIEKFEKVYELSLSDFADEETPDIEPGAKDTIIKLQNEIIQLQRINLNAILKKIEAIYAHVPQGSMASSSEEHISFGDPDEVQPDNAQVKGKSST